jgi:hypothetical protein
MDFPAVSLVSEHKWFFCGFLFVLVLFGANALVAM